MNNNTILGYRWLLLLHCVIYEINYRPDMSVVVKVIQLLLDT